MYKKYFILFFALAFMLSACAAPGSSNKDPVPSAALDALGQNAENIETQNNRIIRAVVSKNCNYIYHMLSVSGCGYENEYGRKYQALHASEDLKTLKKYETHLTVAGGEHTGALYGLCVSLPASLEDSVSLPSYFEALADLFQTDDLEKNYKTYQDIYIKAFSPSGVTVSLDSLKEFYGFNEPMKKEIAEIAKVMQNNFSVYSSEIWEDEKESLTETADALNQQFDTFHYAAKWEKTLNYRYPQEHFSALLVNSIEDGASCIDISFDKDVFYSGVELSSNASIISHEFGIYLLKDILGDTEAFYNLSYHGLVESLAEFYNITVTGIEVDWSWNRDYIALYQKLLESEPELTPEQLFSRAVQSLTPENTQ